MVYLQWPTNRKSYMVYRTAPFSMSLNDPYPWFKVTPFIDAKYLKNGTRYWHSFSGILIATCTRHTRQCYFEWPWLTLSDLAKYSMTRSVARQFYLSLASIGHDPPVYQIWCVALFVPEPRGESQIWCVALFVPEPRGESQIWCVALFVPEPRGESQIKKTWPRLHHTFEPLLYRFVELAFCLSVRHICVFCRNKYTYLQILFTIG